MSVEYSIKVLYLIEVLNSSKVLYSIISYLYCNVYSSSDLYLIAFPFTSYIHTPCISTCLTHLNVPSTMSDHASEALLFRPESKASDHPSEVLRRTLSFRSNDSASSSFAERISKASAKAFEAKPVLRIIGLGSCGSVFEISGTELAYKKGSDTRAIWRDFGLTRTVHYAVLETRRMLQEEFVKLMVPLVPNCHEFYKPDNAIW